MSPNGNVYQNGLGNGNFYLIEKANGIKFIRRNFFIGFVIEFYY